MFCFYFCVGANVTDIPGSWSKRFGGTLRSWGHTWRRISSVSSPPSLMAILLRAATSTGLALRACVISAVFLFRLVSQSERQKTPLSSISLCWLQSLQLFFSPRSHVFRCCGQKLEQQVPEILTFFALKSWRLSFSAKISQTSGHNTKWRQLI